MHFYCIFINCCQVFSTNIQTTVNIRIVFLTKQGLKETSFNTSSKVVFVIFNGFLVYETTFQSCEKQSSTQVLNLSFFEVKRMRKYIVSKTIEHQTKVLELLEELNYKWRIREKNTTFIPMKDFRFSANVLIFDTKECQLKFGHEQKLSEYLAERKMTETTYEELKRKVIL